MIPKIIHQIWVGPNPVPPHCLRFLEKMKLLNPTWKHIIWDNQRVFNEEFKDDPILKKWSQKIGHEIIAPTVLAERIRFLALHKYGGIYADIDSNPIRSFDNILGEINSSVDFFGGYKIQEDPGISREIIDCAIIGSSPKSPTVETLLERMNEGWKNYSWCLIFSNELMKIIEEDPSRIRAFSKEYFYDNEVTEKTIILHDVDTRLWSWRGGVPVGKE